MSYEMLMGGRALPRADWPRFRRGYTFADVMPPEQRTTCDAILNERNDCGRVFGCVLFEGWVVIVRVGFSVRNERCGDDSWLQLALY